MPFIPVPWTVMIELRYQAHGSLLENTLYFWRDGGFTTPLFTALVLHMYNWWNNELRINLGDQLVFRECKGTGLTVPNGAVTYYIPPTLRYGDVVGGTAVPNNVSFSVSFRTASRGRSFRGRNYIPAMRSIMLNGDAVTTSQRDAWLQDYRCLLPGGTYDPLTCSWVVVSRYENGQPRTQGIVTPITQVVAVTDNLGSQRRRLLGSSL